MAKTMLPQALRLPSVPSSLLLVFLACLSLIHAHVVPHIQPNKVAPTRTSLEHKRATLTERASAKVTECLSGDQCTLGCCSSGGYCGFGPDFCAVDVCDASLSANGTCSHLAECDAGFYPGYFDELWGTEYAEVTACPLDVCCSKFGFCGTSSDFCGTTTWPEPSCSGSSAMARAVGYYEAWNQDHPCDHMTPEQIPIAAYTHLNFAFAYIDPSSYAVVPMSANYTDLYTRFTGLKAQKPDLQTWISIGGWTFNDPGATQKIFSNIAASSAAQAAFSTSLIAFMDQYGFDGVDIDWEYPVAEDRGGIPEDYVNFVTWMESLHADLGGNYGLSITIPSSYWYMQNFDIVNLEKHVDFFNFMSYDIYGTWDKVIDEIGPYVYADTNLTVIDQGLQLLWHNNIDPANVNFGIGFYGRGYTLSDPSCQTTGCEFTTGNTAGACTGTEGILSYAEIVSIINDGSINAQVTLDSTETVKIATWGGNQWIGYDDAETLKMKMDYANSHCLGGTMVWAVDLDTTYTLSGAVSGKNVSEITPGGSSIYPDPSIWEADPPEIVCAPPCTFFLPPSPLATPVSITWPPFQTSVLSSSGGLTYTSVTTITIEPFVISSLSLWPVTVTASDTNEVTFTPVQSVKPPSTVITFPGSITLFPPTVITAVPGSSTTTQVCEQTSTAASGAVTTPAPILSGIASDCTKFHEAVDGDSCWAIENQFGLSAEDFNTWNPAVGTDCANGVWLTYYYCIAVGGSASTSQAACGGDYIFTGGSISPIFYTTSHVVTIQPQATVSVTSPDPPGSIRYRTTASSGPLPTWESIDPGCDGCGDWNCGLFGCPPGISPPSGGGGSGECGLFGCDGGCGILGCAGLCGFFGCGCKDCVINSGGGGGLSPNETPQDCDEPEPVEKCTVYVNIYTPTGETTKTTTSKTACATDLVCTSAEDTTTTTTASESGSTLTMTFSQFHTLPPVANAAALASIASAVETFAAGWDGIFAQDTATRTSGATTAAPTATGLCQVTTLDYVDEIYTYCDCGTNYSSTLPLIPSTTAPCDYTELPRICHHGASPQQGLDWCNCDGYPHTLPTLTTENNICGYTSFPDPWPYTATDASGNVLGCESSTVEASTTECAGDHYTISAAPQPTATVRCVTAHTMMDNCLLSGDVMGVEVWENGVQVCQVGKNIFLASDETEYDMDCGNGASVMVTDNGGRLVYQSSDGWQSEIAMTDGHHYTEVCGFLERASGSITDIKGWQFEYIFDNGECGSCHTASLCDYNSPCPDFDGSCS